ncbi:CLM3 protein, partial [Zosterops hypoxanthus]|nr:CLM3 protein [Zosterops hypoxanthus]
LQGQTSEVQRRREGGAVYIECPYTQTEYDYTKHWCLQRDGQWQSLVFTYSGGKGQSRDKRITIKDDTTRKTVSITMTDLKTEDSGTYFCGIYINYNYVPLRTISLNVFHGEYLYPTPNQLFNHPTLVTASLSCSSSENTLVILSVVLFILLLLALVTSTALGVRHYKLLRRAGTWGGLVPGRAFPQPGSTGSRGSSQEDSKGPPYINLDVQSQPSPEDPLYCNVEPSQAHRTPQHVEYAIIAFNQSPRNGRK